MNNKKEKKEKKQSIDEDEILYYKNKPLMSKDNCYNIMVVSNSFDKNGIRDEAD